MSLDHWLINLGYTLVAISFLVRDMVYLRTLAIIAGTMLALSATLAGNWPPVFWNSLFTAINVGRLAHMYLAERAVHLSDEETELYDTIFREMTRLEFLKLLRAGRWVSGLPGTVLATQGQPLSDVTLISSGEAGVEVDGHHVAELRDGHWVGEMSFVTNQPASATVTLAKPTRYLTWPKDSLTALFRRNPTLKLVVTHVMSAELSRKLTRSAQR
jgi:hypothetical protein